MLIGDQYFKENPHKILGVQQERKGRYGQKVIEVKGSLADLRKIKTEPLPRPSKNYRKLASVHTSSKTRKRTINAEKDKALAIRLQLPNTDNADVFHDLRFGSAFWQIYNSHISREELEAYLYAHPEFNHKKFIDSFEFTKSELVNKGLLFYLEGSYYYKFEFITGNIANKLRLLKHSESTIGYIQENYSAKVLKKHTDILIDNLPEAKEFSKEGNTIRLLPHSSLANSFILRRIRSGVIQVAVGKGKKEYKEAKVATLNAAFRHYIRNILDPKKLKKTTKGDILKSYLDNKTEPLPNHLTKNERETRERERIEKKRNAKAEADNLFLNFIMEEVYEEDRKQIEIAWNEKYNAFRLPSEKLPGGIEPIQQIPVAFSQSKYFGVERNGKRMPLRLSDTQRNGVALSASNSILLGYGVGLGKTLTDILAISQLVELGVVKRPLIIVPNNVYYKWRKEIVGETNNEGEFFLGALSHFPPVRDLYNLNNDIIRGLKQYTPEQKQQLKNVDRATELLKEENALLLKKDALTDRIANPKINAYATNALEIFGEIEAKYNATVAEINARISAKISEKERILKRGLLLEEKREFEKLKKSALKEVGFATLIKKQVVTLTKAELFIKEYKRFLKKELDYQITTQGTLKTVAEGTISMVTYEGLSKIGINDPEIVIKKLYNILTQGDQLDSASESAKIHEHMVSLVKSSYENSKIDIDGLGIDSVHIDEVHMAKNIFNSVKGEPKWEYEKDKEGNIILDAQGIPERRQVLTDEGNLSRNTSMYDLTGSTSDRALLTYMLVHYLQGKNRNRGVIGLSATPFNNSPLEIYSIISLINHNVIEQAGFEGIKEFFDTFMKIETEIVIKADNTISVDTVLKGFYNLPQLRQIILSAIDYRTNEQAGTNKPLELVYPNAEHNLKSRMIMTPFQAALMEKVERFMSDLKEPEIAASFLDEIYGEIRAAGLVPEKLLSLLPPISLRKYKEIPPRMKGVAILMGISKMKTLVLSPMLFVLREVGLKLEDMYPLSPRSKVKPLFSPNLLVETSPKLEYIMGCIKSTLQYSRANDLPISGQIVYSTMGTDLFPILTDYLVDPKNGFDLSKNEVATITGKTSVFAKERIKNQFNDGTIKVLFGSKSIQVGVDLQKNTSNLFMLDFDWNPTDDEQVRGRHARQGNRHNWVRTVYAMLENSVDPIIFQYLLEKAARIKEIWDIDKDLDSVDLGDIDFESLRDELITDPVKRAEIEVLREKEKYVEVDYALRNQLDQIKKAPEKQKSFHKGIERIKEIAEEYLLAVSTNEKKQQAEKWEQREITANDRINTWKDREAEISESLAIEKDTTKQEKLKKKLEEAKAKVEHYKGALQKVKANAKDEKQTAAAKMEENWDVIRDEYDFNPTSEHTQKILGLSARMQSFMTNPPPKAIGYGKIYYQREKFGQELSLSSSQVRDFIQFTTQTLSNTGYSMDDIPKLISLLETKMRDNTKEMNVLLESVYERSERIKVELLAQKSNYKTAKDRIKEFEKTHFLLHEKFPKTNAAVNKGAEAIPKTKAKTPKAKAKEVAEARMRMRVRILKLKKIEKIAA